MMPFFWWCAVCNVRLQINIPILSKAEVSAPTMHQHHSADSPADVLTAESVAPLPAPLAEVAKTFTIESGFTRPEGGWANCSLTTSSILLPDVETVVIGPEQLPATDNDNDDDEEDDSEASSSLPSESSGIFYR
jgi:hypothetical protein